MPIAEFATNNVVLSIIKLIPFFTNKGYYTRISFDLEPPTDYTNPLIATQKSKRKKAQNIAKEISEI